MDEYTIKQMFSDCPKMNIVAVRDLISSAYREGFRQSLLDYAWWKDGTQFVGSGVKTLKQADEDFEKDPYYLSMKKA